MATEEITISELELADELLADMNIAVDTSTDTKAITLKQLKAWLGSSLPTGFIVASVGKINDERFTLLDGKTLSRVGTYEAFCNKVVAEVQAGRWTSCTEDQFNQEVLKTGQCNKFVITNDYVRIPKFGNSMYSAVIEGKIPVYGNGKSLGLTEGSNNVGLTVVSGVGFVSAPNAYNVNNGTTIATNNILQTNKAYGLTTDPTKSGIEGTLSTNPMTIYYYMVVSTDGQTASVGVDINKVYEDLELKANSNLSNIASNIDYVVETYRNGSDWYRVYKSGWVEQGGSNLLIGDTKTLLKKFKDTNYNVKTSVVSYNSNASYGADLSKVVKTTTTIKIGVANATYNIKYEWEACGQGA